MQELLKTDLKHHKFADLFPMMNDDEFGALVDDMRQHGYDATAPIVTLNGEILDGRNRYKAAEIAGVMPVFVEYDGDNPLDFVIRHNLKRRHLNESQRAVIAAKLETMKQGRPQKDANLHLKNITRSAAASLLNVSPRTVATVKAVEKSAPDLIEKIESGEMTAHEAQKVVRKQKKEEQRAQAAKLGEKTPVNERAKVLVGDFRRVMADMPENSIDLIFTDPPYDEDAIPMYGELAELAARVLKPGGSLLAYVGHYAILQAGTLMAEHLRFWWTIAVQHSGNSARLPGKFVYVGWKPILWFVKDGRGNKEFVADIFKSKQPTKNEHEWQQDTSEAEYYIEHLTAPNGVVLDPFAGSGTTLLAALNLNRISVGIEIDPDRAAAARKRIHDSA